MGSLAPALERISSSASLQDLEMIKSSIQQVYVALAGNSDLCFRFLRHCADYREKVIGCCLALRTSPRATASNDFRERTTRLRSEMTDVSVENAASVRGLSS